MTYTYRIEDPDDYYPPKGFSFCATDRQQSIYILMIDGNDWGYEYDKKGAVWWCDYRRNHEKVS